MADAQQQHVQKTRTDAPTSQPNMRPDGPRDPVVGPENGPEPPFPLRLDGEVVKGFGRGSKEVRLPLLTNSRPAEAVGMGLRCKMGADMYHALSSESQPPTSLYLVSLWEATQTSSLASTMVGLAYRPRRLSARPQTQPLPRTKSHTQGLR